MKPTSRFIAYYRMSEAEMNAGGGNFYTFEDQRRDIAKYAAEHNATILAEFSEIASGMIRWKRRKILRRAIERAWLCHATLVVGRQNRLSYKVVDICDLLEHDFLKFVAVDNPNRSTFDTHLQVIYDQEYAGELA